MFVRALGGAMEDLRDHVRAAANAALGRRRGASVASIANVLREVRAEVSAELADEEIVAIIIDAAARHHLGLVFDHRQIDI